MIAGVNTESPPYRPALPLFPAGVVGSLPRPVWVRALVDPERREQLDTGERQRQLDVAVAFAIALQEAAGLDIVTDGEWRRDSYVGVVTEMWSGFQRGLKPGVPWWLTVIERISRKTEGVLAREVEFLRKHTTRHTKVCLPSPYLLGRRMWDHEFSRDAYATREAFMEALVPCLREELLAARDAGVDIVQIDDTHLCQFVAERERTRFSDWEQEINLCVSLINAVVEDVDGVTVAVHLCRGNRGRQGWGKEGGYEPIVPALRALNVHQYVMEFAIPAAGDVSVLAELPMGRQIGLGCVDCRNEHVDTPEEIRERVEAALQHVRPERILLNPDCGFAPGSGFDIPLDEAYKKLSNEVAAAVMLRDRYG